VADRPAEYSAFSALPSSQALAFREATLAV